MDRTDTNLHLGNDFKKKGKKSNKNMKWKQRKKQKRKQKIKKKQKSHLMDFFKAKVRILILQQVFPKLLKI